VGGCCPWGGPGRTHLIKILKMLCGLLGLQWLSRLGGWINLNGRLVHIREKKGLAQRGFVVLARASIAVTAGPNLEIEGAIDSERETPSVKKNQKNQKKKREEVGRGVGSLKI